MPLEIFENSIRARVKNPDLFVKSSFRAKKLYRKPEKNGVKVDKYAGIYIVVGKLKSDPDGSMVIQSYVFLRTRPYNWTRSKVRNWLDKYNISLKSNSKFVSVDILSIILEEQNEFTFNNSNLGEDNNE